MEKNEASKKSPKRLVIDWLCYVFAMVALLTWLAIYIATRDFNLAALYGAVTGLIAVVIVLLFTVFANSLLIETVEGDEDET